MGDIRRVGAIRGRAYVALCAEIVGIAPGAGIAVPAMTLDAPLIIMAGFEIIDVDPGGIAIATKIVPATTGVSPLDGVVIGPIHFFPLQGSTVLGDVIGIEPIGGIARIVHCLCRQQVGQEGLGVR